MEIKQGYNIQPAPQWADTFCYLLNKYFYVDDQQNADYALMA